MLKTEIVSPYDLKPTHHLMYDKYKKLEDSENIEDILKTPIVLFGEEKYIYEDVLKILKESALADDEVFN